MKRLGSSTRQGDDLVQRLARCGVRTRRILGRLVLDTEEGEALLAMLEGDRSPNDTDETLPPSPWSKTFELEHLVATSFPTAYLSMIRAGNQLSESVGFEIRLVLSALVEPSYLVGRIAGLCVRCGIQSRLRHRVEPGRLIVTGVSS